MVHRAADSGIAWEPRPDGWLLVLDDPATAGVLLEMLRETMRGGYPLITIVTPVAVDDTWEVECPGPMDFSAPTLGEACARGLLAVWGAPS